ncbi:unnamed protein product [Cochlearia groenlandica]
MAKTSSSSKGPQVFINFRGELRTFVCHLHGALERQGINAFMDSKERPGEYLNKLFERIEESTVAVAILSSKYTESNWCLDELVKIKECVNRGTLWVIPVFFNLNPDIVKDLEGSFGLQLWELWKKKGRDDRILKWDAALQDVRGRAALVLEENGNTATHVDEIATHVQDFLTEELQFREENTKLQVTVEENPKPKPKRIKPGEERLIQLKEKLNIDCNDEEDETRIVGIVGMVGIGKTYLAKKLFKKLKKKIGCAVFVTFDDSEKWTDEKLVSLHKTLADGLLNKPISCGSRNPLEFWKDTLIKKKVVIVFDNVSDKKQLQPLLGGWIKKGSRIVITTRDKSLLNELPCKLYEVPKLNDRESLDLFKAQHSTTIEGSLMELSRKFVDYAGGNPLALKEFGEELCGKSEDHWETRLGTLTQSIGKKLRICFDELNDQEKDVFLDIAHFFISQDESYVRSLLDSFDPNESTEGGKELKSLADKFLISLCDGRVGMHELLLTMAKELTETSGGKYLLFSSNSNDITKGFETLKEKEKVRGVIFDISEMKERPLDYQAFVGMIDLRFIKVYSSIFPKDCEAPCKLNLPEELEFPKDNIVRYFEWMKFPSNELPTELEPNNLIDLRLPYSNITSVWKCAKVTPKLKWVDLSHSRKLSSLLGLSKAPKLLRLNLEGCTSLKNLPHEMKEMTSIVYLNLKGCTSLLSLPTITIHSLKTLILSGCSILETFNVISKNIETLYLDGTAIKGLPKTIGNLHKLTFLNMKDCKNLMALPDCLWKLESLQELKLSRCSMVKRIPDVKGIMKNLHLLLLDETSITEMPWNIAKLSFLGHLCLSRNDKITKLGFDMDEMVNLKWLELKYCKNLTNLARLPPNLQCLNAYGCTSLKDVTNPLAFLMPAKHIHHSTFIFTNCYKLEQVSKNSIISYVQKKCGLMSEDRHNQDFVFKSLIGTCFPGYDIPAWFEHQTFGSELELAFPRDWSERKLNGIALCVVVSFKDYVDQNNGLQVKCNCQFTNEALSRDSFLIGGWSEPGDEPHKIDLDHVFIGYTTLFNIKKRQQFSTATEVSLRFEVTNGTSKVEECEVVKCGFALVYESNDDDDNLAETNSDGSERRYLGWNFGAKR